MITRAEALRRDRVLYLQLTLALYTRCMLTFQTTGNTYAAHRIYFNLIKAAISKKESFWVRPWDPNGDSCIQMTCRFREIDIPMQWFALCVRCRREKVVTEGLRNRNIEAFLPVAHRRRQWSDRVKVTDVPLFTGYVFCRCGYDSRLAVLCTPGVVSFVSFGSGPAAVPAAEIEGIHTIVKSGLPAWGGPCVCKGQRVRIVAGPLAGLEGIMSREKDALRVVVNVEILQRSVSVDVDRAMTSAITPGGRGREIVHSLVA